VQQLNGETVALVVFLPAEKSGSGGQEYRNAAPSVDGSKPGDWGKLVIEGNTYTWTQQNGDKGVAWRNVFCCRTGAVFGKLRDADVLFVVGNFRRKL
jgi:hypothetical protein